VDGQGCDGDLVEIMARMADGDDAAMVTLYERYRTPIAGAVQRELRHRGARLDRDEVGGLVIDVCLELREVAGAWSPDGGAKPWVWARRRIGNVVDRALGQHADPLDEARLASAEAPAPVGRVGDRSLVDALARVAPDLESARLVADALDEARISPRDRELVLEYAYEKQAGNPAPATTVAAAFGMKEATVRQAFRRAVQRLRRLAAEDERFAPLAELPLLA